MGKTRVYAYWKTSQRQCLCRRLLHLWEGDSFASDRHPSRLQRWAEQPHHNPAHQASPRLKSRPRLNQFWAFWRFLNQVLQRLAVNSHASRSRLWLMAAWGISRASSGAEPFRGDIYDPSFCLPLFVKSSCFVQDICVFSRWWGNSCPPPTQRAARRRFTAGRLV